MTLTVKQLRKKISVLEDDQVVAIFDHELVLKPRFCSEDCYQWQYDEPAEACQKFIAPHVFGDECVRCRHTEACHVPEKPVEKDSMVTMRRDYERDQRKGE